ncbi:hypothetical protein ACFL7M_09625 [Thermodesulfobacteriota bacterium]
MFCSTLLSEASRLGIPIKLSETSPNPDCGALELGQNTEEILLEFGYTWEEIIKLKDEGTIMLHILNRESDYDIKISLR